MCKYYKGAFLLLAIQRTKVASKYIPTCFLKTENLSGPFQILYWSSSSRRACYRAFDSPNPNTRVGVKKIKYRILLNAKLLLNRALARHGIVATIVKRQISNDNKNCSDNFITTKKTKKVKF